MGRKLNIMFVAPFGIRHRSTVWARALPLARELNRLGHSARILVPPWDSPHDAGTMMVRDGVLLEHVELGCGLAAVTARLLRSIRSQRPDIVHIVKPRAYAGIVQWLLWHAHKVDGTTPRIVLDIDDWERPWAAINRYPLYQSIFLQWQEEWGIRHADGITAASRWLVERAKTAAPGVPIIYVPNGIDRLEYDVAHDYRLRRPPRVLFLSRFVEVTPAWLGEFWQALSRENDDTILLVAGRALHPRGEAPYLNALATSHPVDRGANVVWCGYINPDDLSDLFGSVDCAVFPSDNTAILKAKCSVRMATALQNGVPIIASEVGEQSYYGGQGAARLVPSNTTPVEFARAVAEVLNSADQRREMGRTAVAHMDSDYAWSTFAKRLEHFYSELLANG